MINEQKLDSCPVCGEKQIRKFLDVQDHSISKETFTIEECMNCGLKFTNPRPTENTIGKYYQSEEYVSHSDTKKGLINRLYHIVRSYTLKGKIHLIDKYSTGKRLLDVGCGTGYFLKYAKDHNYKVIGMEPDSTARALAHKNLNQEIYSSIFSIDQSEKIDVVTMWHVLEHVHQLPETLIKIKALLKSKGTLVIAVPNAESYDAEHYKQYWAAYDVPRHLYHFNQKSMSFLLHKFGFDMLKIKPMYFDSYYVSMMSEKYHSKENKINYLKAFFSGFKSNKRAKNHNKNYSSLIYIAQKVS
jgi:2-polyprenyl-3-methyl-5-hydroxy-6-metoxy-1,4-benzoquinol methylase